MSDELFKIQDIHHTYFFKSDVHAPHFCGHFLDIEKGEFVSF